MDAANSCSNHGKCSTKDACVCDRGFSGADCSLVSRFDECALRIAAPTATKAFNSIN